MKRREFIKLVAAMTVAPAATISTPCRITGDPRTPLMRVRRESDDEEAVIYTLADAERFADDSDLYVVAWCNQSGNGPPFPERSAINHPVMKRLDSEIALLWS